MGKAGWVRLGRGKLRALPAWAPCEMDLDAQGVPVAIAFEVAEGEADDGFGLYPDLADAIAGDGGLDELD